MHTCRSQVVFISINEGFFIGLRCCHGVDETSFVGAVYCKSFVSSRPHCMQGIAVVGGD